MSTSSSSIACSSRAPRSLRRTRWWSRSPSTVRWTSALHPPADRQQHDRGDRRQRHRAPRLQLVEEEQGRGRDADPVEHGDERRGRPHDETRAVGIRHVVGAVPQDAVDARGGQGEQAQEQRRLHQEAERGPVEPEHGRQGPQAPADPDGQHDPGHDPQPRAGDRVPSEAAAEQDQQGEGGRDASVDDQLDRRGRPRQARDEERVLHLRRHAGVLGQHDEGHGQHGERGHERADPHGPEHDALPSPLEHAVGEGPEHQQEADGGQTVRSEADGVEVDEPRPVHEAGMGLEQHLVRRPDGRGGGPERHVHRDGRGSRRQQPHAEDVQRQDPEDQPAHAAPRPRLRVHEAAHGHDVGDRPGADHPEQDQPEPADVHTS